MKPKNQFLHFCRTVVSLLMILITGYLFLLSIFGTSMINAAVGYETTVFLSDSPLFHLAAILLILLIGYLIKKKIGRLPVSLRKYLPAGAAIIFFFIGSFVVIRLSLLPTAAQYWSLDAAGRLLSGDYGFWERSGFCYIYPMLNSFILFLVPFAGIFGIEGGAVAFQMFNLLMLLLAAYALYGFCKETGCNAALSFLLFLFFLPFTCYVFFVYGNVASLSLSVCAMWTAVRYLRKGRLRDAVISAVLINIAVLFKDTSLIAMIALGIIIFLYAVCSCEKKKLIWLPLCLALYLIAPLIVNGIPEGITGQEVPEGMGIYGHLLMGISEGERAEGWYNGYTFDTLVACDFDYDAYHAAAKQAFKERSAVFWSDPSYAATFFSRKTASQWNNPTFQSVWIVQQMLNASDRPNTGVFQDGSSINMGFFFFCNLYQSLILFGALSFFVLNGLGNGNSENGNSLLRLLPAITFLGGFLFLLFWEAKAQYTLLFFVLLIPYSVEGFSSLLHSFLAIRNSMTDKSQKWYRSKAVVFSAVLLLIIFLTALFRQPGTPFFADGDEAYAYYLEENIRLSAPFTQK